MKKKHAAKQFHIRLRVIYGVIILVALVLVYKLVSLQLVHGDTYYELANRQYTGVAQSFLDRGAIFFIKKDGERVSAATVQSGYRLFIDPTKLGDAEEAYAALNTIVEIDRESFMTKAAKVKDPYEEVAFQLDDEMAQAVRDLDLDGVGLARDQWRYYPADDMASQVIGFLGYNGDKIEGRYGLEKYYEETLKRGDDELYVNFFAQVFSDVGEVMKSADEREGDLITTLEPHVQAFIDEKMENTMERWNAAAAGAIVVDPQTGAVLAMSSSDKFDLNNFREVSSPEQFSNPLVQGVYEMGSIIKPLIMAIAIDSGAVTPQTEYYDAGSIDVGKYTIWNFDKRGRGTVTMTEVLKQSLNTGMVYLSQVVKRSEMKRYLYSLGLDGKTGIDLPYETKSLVNNLESNREVEYANIAFGQGIALTPIATVRALSALANGGRLYQPYVVQKIDFASGLAKKIEPQLVAENLFKPATVEKVTRMLVALVDDNFKKDYPQLEPYTIAAKTGTAQIAHPQGGYYDDRNLHSFVGYFPAYDPEFLVFFYLMHPKGVRYSSQTLSGPFMETAQFLINYYDIPPDRIEIE